MCVSSSEVLSQIHANIYPLTCTLVAQGENTNSEILIFVSVSLFFFFFFGHMACRVLIPQPGIEPVSPVVEVWSLNHWTAREFPSETDVSK